MTTTTEPAIAQPTFITEDQLVEGGISDAELEELALATPFVEDPEALLNPTPFRRSGLPAAYLPGAMPGPHRRWQAAVALLLVAAFLTITMLGFCVTYGQISFA